MNDMKKHHKYPTDLAVTREFAKYRDGYRCQSCRTSENLEVHHIETDIEDIHMEDNLITLCRTCHRKLPHRDQNRAPRIILGIKIIQLDDDVHERLKSLGKKGETFSDIVKRILDSYDLCKETK